MTNCFAFRCPQCGGTDRIDIAAEVWVRVTVDGTATDAAGNGDHLWDPASPALAAAAFTARSPILKPQAGQVRHDRARHNQPRLPGGVFTLDNRIYESACCCTAPPLG